jgi:hypothetical protein
MVERLSAAQVDLDTASAAFKYRYKIIWPASLPTEPFSPNPFKLLGLGTISALFLALLVAALPDIRAGRILMRWQIEKSLSIPVLASFRSSPVAAPSKAVVKLDAKREKRSEAR